MSDQYFKDRAERILRVKNYDIITKEEYDAAITLLSFNLKEVARDQRYACIEAVTYLPDNIFTLEDIIQNANIKIKK